MSEQRVIVFVGPTLSVDDARKIVRADFRPPAKQGDVFRALADDPQAIVLIDGVFESAPSVWHHELLAAHAAGVHLFGGSSMGALRAAELPGVVTPVGVIAANYVNGTWNDDSWVAVHHADAELSFKGLSVAHVNVWATLAHAVKRRVIPSHMARRVERASESIFYQERTWQRIFKDARLSEADVRRLKIFVEKHAVDLKARDARRCLERAAKVRQKRKPRVFRPSSFVRRKRLVDVYGTQIDQWLACDDANEMMRSGKRHLLLVEFARFARLTPSPKAVAEWSQRLQLVSMSADERATMAETLALEDMLLDGAERFVPDGPSDTEGLIFAHRLRQVMGRPREPKTIYNRR